MAKGGRWVIRTYKSGRVEEKSRVYTVTDKPIRKRKVKGNTNAAKADANFRQEVKVLARVLNANFSLTPSLFIKLGYDNAHACGQEETGLKQAKKDGTNFLRRLNRALKKAGVKIVKTVKVCSDLDGDTGELVREHIHLVITGEGITYRDGAWYAGADKLEDIWGRGGVWVENVARGSDLTPLAYYLLRQCRKQENAKKYTCSRNMTPTTVTEEEIPASREMKAPRGCTVRDTVYDQESGAVTYIRYIRPAKRGESTAKTGETAAHMGDALRKNGGSGESNAPAGEKAKASGKDGAKHGI